MKLLKLFQQSSLILFFLIYPLEGLVAQSLLSDIDKHISSSSGQAKKRFQAWSKLIQTSKDIPIKQKMERVNNFFNLFKFISDTPYQGGGDRWKTPDEFVRVGGGDCEDYAIAKYFTLLALDVPMKKMRITYVKAIKLNQAHMVLAYYPSPHEEPYILDNLDGVIKKASQRPDLVPVYSFNTDDIWLSRPTRGDRYIGSNNLKQWQAVLQRMKPKENK